MDLYDELCNKLCWKIKDQLNDTYVSVSYIQSSDLLEIYVRHRDLKFRYNIRNLSRHILYGYSIDQITRDFITEWKNTSITNSSKKKKD